jgi:hypothetical protein
LLVSDVYVCVCVGGGGVMMVAELKVAVLEGGQENYREAVLGRGVGSRRWRL